MYKTVSFLFVIDVSGSMYGQKIAAVNAALMECLTELKQICSAGEFDIKVSIITFAETLQVLVINERPGNVGAPHINVEPQQDGFYPVTYYDCLYSGLRQLFESGRIVDEKQGENTFIFLFSDAKPVDERDYGSAFDKIQGVPGFKNAVRYFGFAEEGTDKYNRNSVRFVDYKADRIIRVPEMPGEINKLQMTFFSDFFSSNDKYDQIFV